LTADIQKAGLIVDHDPVGPSPSEASQGFSAIAARRERDYHAADHPNRPRKLEPFRAISGHHAYALPNLKTRVHEANG
jgi:hypothetical protein